MARKRLPVIAIMLAATSAFAQPSPPKPDASPHTVKMVPVAEGVELEVLDWGGSGPPLVFLAGLGATAHVFDDFAPRFAASHHVYAITRRGWGSSGKPAPDQSNYSAGALGGDVLKVIAELKLDHPVLAGHSLAGEELSWVAERHPDAVAGVIYLEAAYAYAYYAPGNLNPPNANLTIDARSLREKIDALGPLWLKPPEGIAAVDALDKDLDLLRKDLAATRTAMRKLPSAPAEQAPPGAARSQIKIAEAIQNGIERFGPVKVPVLAIFAVPQALPPNAPPAVVEYARAIEKAGKNALVERYRAGNPAAHVVVIPNAQHAVFKSNPDEVAKEMDKFLAGLPETPAPATKAGGVP